jgi:serine/threonine protein kinase
MEDLSGKQLGVYQILNPLGEGGMAAVFRAYQPNLGRNVAVKVLPRQLAQEQGYMARFRQEAMILARMQHPHILSIFDFGESGGYTYLVMPLVSGGTLAQKIQGKPLGLEYTARIISQVASALDYAHAQGIIHRDIKPSNILLDEQGNCLLSDFGIARMVEGTASFTSTGVVIGTPAYMSPEQGRGEKLTPSSDIYSLGIVAYEMVTGRVPFLAETPVAVIFKHIQETLPPPRALNPELPHPAEWAIQKALAKTPSERFGSAGDFAAALQAALPRTGLGEPGQRSAAQPAVQTRYDLPQPTSNASPSTAVQAPTSPVRPPAKSQQGGWLFYRVPRGLVAAAVALLTLAAVAYAAVINPQQRAQRAIAFQSTQAAASQVALAYRDQTLEAGWITLTAQSGLAVTPTSGSFPTDPAKPPTATAAPISVKTSTPIPISTPPPTATITPAAIELAVEKGSIGESVSGLPIAFLRIGTGQKVLVIGAAIHGEEKGAANFAQKIAAWLEQTLDSLPADTRVYVLTSLNPDGSAANTRYNANKIDLNRNWLTQNWITDATGPAGIVKGSGGSQPFSEPETKALSTWLLGLKNQSQGRLAVVFYHLSISPEGEVLPAYDLLNNEINPEPSAARYAQLYARAAGYQYLTTWTHYSITGEAINWCGEQQLACFDVELPWNDAKRNDQQTQHQNAILQLLKVIGRY